MPSAMSSEAQEQTGFEQMSGIGPGAASDDLTPWCAVDVNLATDFTIDNTVFACGYARELFVGTGGTVIARMIGDVTDHTYKNVPSGSTLSGKFTLVRSTGNGTTALDIVARR